MNSSTLPISKIEVTVKSIDRHFAVLEITGKNQEISWPVDSLPPRISTGEKLALECRITQENNIQKIVETAKARSQSDQKSESMKRLLEELIN